MHGRPARRPAILHFFLTGRLLPPTAIVRLHDAFLRAQCRHHRPIYHKVVGLDGCAVLQFGHNGRSDAELGNCLRHGHESRRSPLLIVDQWRWLNVITDQFWKQFSGHKDFWLSPLVILLSHRRLNSVSFAEVLIFRSLTRLDIRQFVQLARFHCLRLRQIRYLVYDLQGVVSFRRLRVCKHILMDHQISRRSRNILLCMQTAVQLQRWVLWQVHLGRLAAFLALAF